MLGATQLGLVFGEDPTFCGVECEVKNAAEHKVDFTVDIPHGMWA